MIIEFKINTCDRIYLGRAFLRIMESSSTQE